MTQSLPRETEPSLRLGQRDQGRRLTREEYERATYAPGIHYELVAGRLDLTPLPNRSHDWIEVELLELLRAYAHEHPTVIDYVTNKARLITQALGGDTDPEPDIAAYRAYPTEPFNDSWVGVLPVLVVEIISPGTADKDLVRNREIYGEVDGISEYWIVDPRSRPPSARVLTRFDGPEAWAELLVPPGGTLRSDLLPGLEIDLSTIAPD